MALEQTDHDGSPQREVFDQSETPGDNPIILAFYICQTPCYGGFVEARILIRLRRTMIGLCHLDFFQT